LIAFVPVKGTLRTYKTDLLNLCSLKIKAIQLFLSSIEGAFKQLYSFFIEVKRLKLFTSRTSKKIF
jgi:hypothetical protein